MNIWDMLTGGSGQPSAVRDLDLRAYSGDTYEISDPTLIPFIGGGRATNTGKFINEQNAMKNSAFNRAVLLICNAMGMLPVHGYTTTTNEDGTDTPEVASDHYVHELLHNKPNGWMTPFEFKSYMFSRAILSKKGIAYAMKLYKLGPKGKRIPRALIPLNPDEVEAKLNDKWELEFTWQPKNGTRKVIPWQDMFWFRGPYSRDGVNSVSLVETASEALGLSMTAEETAGRVMKNGAISGIVLEHPKALSEPAMERLRNQFDERHSGPNNAGKTIVAEEGMKVAAGGGGTTLKDAQGIEQRKFQIEEIARFTGIPRPLLMVDETSWGSGIEQLGLFFITYCLMPWFIVFEEAVKRSLLSEEDQGQYYAKFNEGALLRGSLKDQAEFFSKALGAGSPGANWMTQDEVRDKFDMGPKGGKANELASAAEKPEAQGQPPTAPGTTEPGGGNQGE